MPIFRDTQDHTRFYGILRSNCEKLELSILAHCLMSNHFHLAPRGERDQIRELMWRTDLAYSVYHNDRYEFSGHAFEKSYYCGAIPTPFVLQRVIRYIHLNPVRAGLSNLPEEYPWSSHRKYSTGGRDPFPSDIGRVLSTFNLLLPPARAAYNAFVMEDLARPVPPVRGKSPTSEIWREQCRWLLDAAKARAGGFAPVKPLTVAAYWSARVGIPPRIIGQVLEKRSSHHVSQMLYRFSKYLQENDELKQQLETCGII